MAAPPSLLRDIPPPVSVGLRLTPFDSAKDCSFIYLLTYLFISSFLLIDIHLILLIFSPPFCCFLPVPNLALGIWRIGSLPFQLSFN